MRVISGSAKGVRLKSPRGMVTRPTSDRVRTTVFDILGPFSGGRALDLFAGTGAMGIEALSRGADEAVFVEADRQACSVIGLNLAAARFRSQAEVVTEDVVRFVSGSARSPFDLVFIDPPYECGLALITQILARLAEGNWLRVGGTAIVEAEVGALAIPSRLRETRTRRFGRTQITAVVREG